MEINIENIKIKNNYVSFKMKESGIYSFVGNSKSIKRNNEFIIKIHW